MIDTGENSSANEVSEADASDEVAAIYADIRETMAMSFVNLIWRRLAISPDGLRWTWNTMKPLYADDVIYSHAVLLRDEQDLPGVPRLPEAALRAIGIDVCAETSIRAALAGYDRGNPLNLVAFSAVLARLNGNAETVNVTVALAEVRADPDSVNAMRRPTPPVPPMQSFAEMDEITAAIAHAVNGLGADEEGSKVRVSLPRNLAHWPGFLSLYFAVLAPLHNNGQLGRAVASVLSQGHARGAQLLHRLGDTGSPPDHLLSAIRQPIQSLVPHAMGRMIPVVSLLQRMMPIQAGT